MEFALIKNGMVVNVIVADQDFITMYYPGAVRIDNIRPVPGIGWSYDGSTFSPPA